jgi:cbb3-type cytochrome oxidase subunit 3
MSETLKNLAVMALALHVIAVIWFAASPSRVGHWAAAMDIAYDSIWSEYVFDCDCTQPLE